MNKFLAASSSRRGVLKCLAWGGTGLVWTVSGGVPRVGPWRGERDRSAEERRFYFRPDQRQPYRLQGQGQHDPNSTLQLALDRIGKLSKRPALHAPHRRCDASVEAAGCDTADQILKGGEAEKAQLHTRANMMSSATMGSSSSPVSPRRRPRAAGTASITAACISSR